MWKMTKAEIFNGSGFAIVTEETEEMVGLFFERDDADLFLEALKHRALMTGILNSIERVKIIKELADRLNWTTERLCNFFQFHLSES